MAAGGGRSTSTISTGENWLSPDFQDIPGSSHTSAASLFTGSSNGESNSRAQQGLRINTSVGGNRVDDDETLSATSSVRSDVSGSDMSSSMASENGHRTSAEREVWKGDVSAVIGLQKRGLRGLMEGRRLRERGASVGQAPRVGLGIGGA